MNYTVFEHEVPDHFNPRVDSNISKFGQNHSKLEAINEHAFKDDVIIALDAGWDHIYHYGINEWKEGIQILYSFERGFGPHSMAFSSRERGYMYVMGEYTPAFAVLHWDQEKHNFTEVARVEMIKPGMNWTGADILVDQEEMVYVSIRHNYNES